MLTVAVILICWFAILVIIVLPVARFCGLDTKMREYEQPTNVYQFPDGRNLGTGEVIALTLYASPALAAKEL